MATDRFDRLSKITREMDDIIPKMLACMSEADALAFLKDCKKDYAYDPSKVPDKGTAPPNTPKAASKTTQPSKSATSPFVNIAKKLEVGQPVTALLPSGQVKMTKAKGAKGDKGAKEVGDKGAKLVGDKSDAVTAGNLVEQAQRMVLKET